MKTRSENNSQLALLPEYVGKELEVSEIKPVSQRKAPAQKRKSRLGNKETWWKLSEKDKLVGIAGIQSVRDVLAKCDDLPAETLAKAS